LIQSYVICPLALGNPEASGRFIVSNGRCAMSTQSNVTLATLLILVCALAVGADAPRGWLLAGSKPSEFEAGVDRDQTHQGHNSAFLKSKQSSVSGFGTLMQNFAAERYLGKRVRFSGLVKAQDVSGWAGLWVRVDKSKEVVAFDNMESRPVRGTADWRRCEVVLDVPSDATGIALGVLLNGPGEVWLNGAKFEVVASDVPTTNTAVTDLPDKPINLDFLD
jgi:hypothetical protein